MATPAAVLSILVKTQGVQATAGQLDAVDRAGRNASKGLGKAEGAAKRAHGTFSTMKGTAITAGAALGVAGLGKGVSTAITEFREAQRVGAQTNAVIKSTGGSAKVTAQQVGTLATAISKKSGIDDEAIQKGANLLLTFKNIRNETGKGKDIFNQATRAATDLSAAGFGSLESTSKQLGKALNDPVKGLTALGRSGVTFSEDQKKAITALMDTGKAADRVKAQQIILKEVQSQVGGSAQAQATNADKLRVSLGNLAEKVGGKLAPLIDQAAGKLSKFTDEMAEGKGTGGQVADAFGRVADAVKRVAGVVKDTAGLMSPQSWAILAGAIGGVAGAVWAINTAMKVARATMVVFAAAQWAVNLAMSANPAVAIGLALLALGTALVIAYKKSETFRNIVNGAFEAVRQAIANKVASMLGVVSTLLTGIGKVAKAVGADGLAKKAFEGAHAIDDLRSSLTNLPSSKDVQVKVKIKLDGQDIDVTNAKPLSPTPPGGDGPGVIGSRINDLVRANGGVKDGIKKLVADGIGSVVPGVGGAVGSLMGASASLRPFAAVGAQFGLHVTSGLRPGAITSSGNTSYHASGRAIDLGNGKGPDAAKLSAFKALKARYGPMLAELIYTPGGVGIKNGQPFRYTGQVAADHYDHVHVAFTGGSRALGQAGNRGDGLGRFIGDGLGDEQQWLNDSWAKVAPLFGKSASNTPLPSLFKHIRFSGASPFVGVATTPGKGMETAELLWPRWLWQSSKGQKKLDPRTKMQLFIHEMAHRFQSVKQTGAMWQSEGGAEAFARIMMGRHFGGAIRNGSDPYNAFVTRVMKEKGVGWVTSGQFANATAGAGMPGAGGISTVAKLAKAAGFKGQALVNAIAIAGAESGFRANASNRNSNGTIDRGYWQINSIHGAKSTFDPAGNARAAFSISSGGRNWRPWVTYNTGAYQRFLDQARSAAGSISGTAAKGTAGGGATTTTAGSGAASTAAKVNPFDQKIASADLAIQQANTAPNRVGSRSVSRGFQQVQAMTAKRKLIGSRIRSIRKALKGKLSGTKRLALTQELTQRLQEHAQLGTDIQALRHPAAAGGDGGSIGDIGGGAGTGDAGDPNQALIDSNTALQAKIDEQIAAEKEHTDVLAAVKAEIKRQTDFATAVTNTSNFQLTKSLADLLSGQIVGYGVAGRKMTPGTGVEHAY